MLIRNINMSKKNKWGGAEDPTINNLHTIGNRKLSMYDMWGIAF